jgi:hypothetical protein
MIRRRTQNAVARCLRKKRLLTCRRTPYLRMQTRRSEYCDAHKSFQSVELVHLLYNAIMCALASASTYSQARGPSSGKIRKVRLWSSEDDERHYEWGRLCATVGIKIPKSEGEFCVLHHTEAAHEKNAQRHRQLSCHGSKVSG